MTGSYPLRPFLVADTPRLQDLFAQSIAELTTDDYGEDQRLAWISRGADGVSLARRLEANVTLVVEVGGEILGFASLAGNREIDMLYVHPHAAGTGVASALVDAIERIAAARGADHLVVEASDTALPFFEKRGYLATARNSKPVEGVWLANTTLQRQLKPASADQSRRRS